MLFGLDMGWKTGQTVDMNWSYRPSIAAWLIPQATFDTRYRYNRGASFISEVEGDSVLTSDFSNSRTLRFSLGFNAPVLLRGALGSDRTGLVGALLGLVDWFDILTGSWSGALNSRFQRETARPDLKYQFGLGGFDSFRVQDGDTASRASQGHAARLA